MSIPKICRDNIDFTSDTEVCNIGYNEGVLNDGRPYRIEVWDRLGVINATVFISIIGLENASENEIKNMIVQNNIIEIIDDNIYITELDDLTDSTFISINVPIESESKILNKYLVDLKSYDI